MTDPYLAKLLETQNRILLRQAEALEKIAKALAECNINAEVRTVAREKEASNGIQ